MIAIDKNMKIHIALTKEEDYWIARCVEFMITDTGNSKDEAIKNLKKTMIDISKEYDLKVVPSQESLADWETIEEEIEL
jgi:pyruvate-formate lyase